MNKYMILCVLLLSLFIDFKSNAQLSVEQGDDVSLTRNGYVRIGPEAGLDLVLDVNELQTRANNTASSFFINLEGGTIQFGRDAATAGNLILKKMSELGNRNLWVDNEGFVKNVKRERKIKYGSSVLQSLDTEKDFIYSIFSGVKAKNNRGNTGVAFHLPLVYGAEIKSVKVLMKDANAENKLRITLNKLSSIGAILNTYVSDPYDQCIIFSCVGEANIPLPGNLLIEEPFHFMLEIRNQNGLEWEDDVSVFAIEIVYLEP